MRCISESFVRAFSLTLLSVAILAPFASSAQQSQTSATTALTQTCATDALQADLLDSSSEYARSWAAFETAMKARSDAPASSRSVLDGIVSIPTVVHIMHEGTAEGVGGNVPNAQVLAAIDALNADFSGQTGGTNVEVQFCLASRAPSGEPTNGIVRFDMSVQFPSYSQTGLITPPGGGVPTEMDMKSLSNWEGEDYLNIWVVPQMNSGGNPLGYAYMPPITGLLDGVVLRADVFGADQRTLTHEVGHYLGLYHTFNGTSSCSTVEPDCSMYGDRVCDTPPTTTGWSCTAGCPEGLAENFMDYTSDACMSAFTEGQRTRMRAAIAEHRATLLDSDGCWAPSTDDVGAVAIASLGESTCNPDVSAEVEIFNYGTDILTSTTIEFQLDASPLGTVEWSGTLAPGASTAVALPTLAAGYGAHNLQVWVSLPNGNSDGYTDNNQITHAFTVDAGEQLAFTLHTDASPMETNWTLTNDSTGTAFLSGGNYDNGTDANQTLSYGGCAVGGCYTLTITDLFSDGLGLWPNGWYTLTLGDGTILAEGSGDFGAQVEHHICFDGSLFEGCEDENENGICDDAEAVDEGDPLSGCTDQSACNYAAAADVDNGNCVFAEAGLDCDGNPSNATFDPAAGPSEQGEVDGVGEIGTAADLSNRIKLNWTLAPNPTNSGRLVALGLPISGPYTLRVLDTTGRLIAKSRLEATDFSDGARLEWTGWSLPAGCYLIGLTPERAAEEVLPFKRLTVQ
jgi:hypothetical protein